MPKLLPSETEKMNLEFRALYESKKIRERWEDKKIAKIVGTSLATVLRRKRNPEDMSLGEFRRYAKLLGMTDKDVCAVAGVKYKDE